MRGLRLFVRPIDHHDDATVRAFLARNASAAGTPACGLLGKLLGDVVAVASLELTGDALRVDDLVVAAELRRKRIGRVMMSEVEQLAAKLDRGRVVVENARGAQEFLQKVGFDFQGERWVRVVRS
ncbi:MAG TPA: GNAT family N-acetyltransferase [Thermoanaerobaculia bacterium]|jgi:GNAT superfamily N-acetyltransferase